MATLRRPPSPGVQVECAEAHLLLAKLLLDDLTLNRHTQVALRDTQKGEGSLKLRAKEEQQGRVQVFTRGGPAGGRGQEDRATREELKVRAPRSLQSGSTHVITKKP